MVGAPNILIVMVDQLNGTIFPDGPAEFLHAPALRRLAGRSARFANTYCASPLCAPSRASFMSGMLPSRTGVYDNAAEFASAIPTFAHHLRRAGYRAILAGKMHFVGPDQLHGFEERLTTDIYPADFGWTPDWSRPHERIDWWYHNLGSVQSAGTAEITNQIEFDEEVAFLARQRLHQLARRADDRPFCLTVSFTHPHDPYVARPEFWDLYPPGRIPPLAVPAIAYEAQDPHARRLLDMSDWRRFALTDQQITDSRRGYCANISFLDSLIEGLLDTLERCGFGDDTVVVFTSDHGDMLGERGLWFKMSYLEGAARVPLLIAAPGLAAGLRSAPASTLDVLPTLLDLAGIVAPSDERDGTSLLGTRGGFVAGEYAAEGAIAPMIMLRDARYKFIASPVDPPLFFDLDADPHEQRNLALHPALPGFAAEAARRWNLASFDADVRRSQARRHAVYPALRNGNYYPWDFQPLQQAAERYTRNHMDVDAVDRRARYPLG